MQKSITIIAPMQCFLDSCVNIKNKFSRKPLNAKKQQMIELTERVFKIKRRLLSKKF
jgi:hypothetical protein